LLREYNTIVGVATKKTTKEQDSGVDLSRFTPRVSGTVEGKVRIVLKKQK